MLNENTLSGYVRQYERVFGQFREARRWAWVSSRTLYIAAGNCLGDSSLVDKHKPNLCVKINLSESFVSKYVPEEETPWISVGFLRFFFRICA